MIALEGLVYLHGEFMIVAVIFDTASNLLVARPNDLSKVTNRLVWALALASLVIVPVLLLCESFDDMRGTSEERGRAGGETIAVVMVFLLIEKLMDLNV